jgi:hypothetical protein
VVVCSSACIFPNPFQLCILSCLPLCKFKFVCLFVFFVCLSVRPPKPMNNISTSNNTGIESNRSQANGQPPTSQHIAIPIPTSCQAESVHPNVLQEFQVAELKDMADNINCKTSGNKDQLIERLLANKLTFKSVRTNALQRALRAAGKPASGNKDQLILSLKALTLGDSSSGTGRSKVDI